MGEEKEEEEAAVALPRVKQGVDKAGWRKEEEEKVEARKDVDSTLRLVLDW